MLEGIKRYFKLRESRKRFILLGKMIDSIDKSFIKNQVSRQVRRQFWSDFVNSPENRKKFIQEMGKQYGL